MWKDCLQTALKGVLVIMVIKVIVLVIMAGEMVIVIVSQLVKSSSLLGVVVKIIVLLNMVIVMIIRSGQSKLHYVLFLAKVKVKFLVATDICKQPLPAKEESFQSSQGPVISWHSTWVGATMKYNEWFP